MPSRGDFFPPLNRFIPGLSPLGNFTVIFPLVSVIVLSMLKAAFEDIRRWVSDRKSNSRECTRLSSTQSRSLHERREEKVARRKIRVGDLIKVTQDQEFPADLIILSSSDDHGVAFVETSVLDGETNLNAKRAVNMSVGLRDPSEFDFLGATFECEPPSDKLYSWQGTVEFSSVDLGVVKKSLDLKNIALRGSVLRNVGFVLGLAVYTGQDTKLMLNRAKPRHKQSSIERFVNVYIFVWICIMVLLSLACVGAEIVWLRFFAGGHWYLGERALSAYQMFRDFWSFIILFNTLLPITMYISCEIAQIAQAFLVQQDLQLFDAQRNCPAIVRTSAVNEELGQVSYVLTDKTGTLTTNEMTLVNFSVAGVSYALSDTRGQDGLSAATSTPYSTSPESEQPFSDDSYVNESGERRSLLENTAAPIATQPSFSAGLRLGDDSTGWLSDRNAGAIRELLVLLCLCNTVLPINSDSDDNVTSGRSTVQYVSTSKDEIAFVQAASELGVSIANRAGDEVTLRVAGEQQPQVYTILQTVEFCAHRKRMEVICRDADGSVLLLIKGADSVVTPLLGGQDSPAYRTAMQHLNQYSVEGLRTMVCAQAEIPAEVYAEWEAKYEQIKCSADADRALQLDRALQQLEAQFPARLVGITAVEDRLQQGVPDTIKSLQLAGIRCWMLTGDKRETAVSVARASGLVRPDSDVIVLNDSLEHYSEQIRRACESSDNRVLVVSGEQLDVLLGSKGLRSLLVRAACSSHAVIACRASPSQKAELAALIRKSKKKVCLAIGDGGNDVSMIQQASVGVGISGSEGVQAANAADISISQFRMLARLLFVHGRWNYRRNSKLLLYNAYKNVVLYLTQFFFAFFNGFSQASVHERWALSLHTTLFTSLPVLAFAIFDKDIPASVAMNRPELYKSAGPVHRFFNARVFLGWLANSVFHSAMCFFLPAFMLQFVDRLDGKVLDTNAYGVTIYGAVMLVIHGKLWLETASPNVFNLLSMAWSFAVWAAAIVVLGFLYRIHPSDRYPMREFGPSIEMYGIMREPSFYLIVLVTAAAALLRDFVWKAIIVLVRPAYEPAYKIRDTIEDA